MLTQSGIPVRPVVQYEQIMTLRINRRLAWQCCGQDPCSLTHANFTCFNTTQDLCKTCYARYHANSKSSKTVTQVRSPDTGNKWQTLAHHMSSAAPDSIQDKSCRTMKQDFFSNRYGQGPHPLCTQSLMNGATTRNLCETYFATHTKIMIQINNTWRLCQLPWDGSYSICTQRKTSFGLSGVCLFVGWLLNVPATG